MQLLIVGTLYMKCREAIRQKGGSANKSEAGDQESSIHVVGNAPEPVLRSRRRDLLHRYIHVRQLSAIDAYSQPL